MFGLDVSTPTDNINTWLGAVLKKLHAKALGNDRLDYELAARYVIERYRRGQFGQFTLDDLDEESVSSSAPSTPTPTPSREMNRTDVMLEDKGL